MSNLSAFPYIGERSEATPGLWNNPLSIISANIAAINSEVTFSLPSGNTFSLFTSLDASGNVHAGERIGIGQTPSADSTAVLTIAASSATADYIQFEDISGARSDYILGSRVGGTADGLNLYDKSGDTLIVSFSKQSVRFYQNVVGPVFDVGGALANTLNAATFGTGADSNESRIQAAISAASSAGIARVYVPANMYPYSTLSVSFSTDVQMVREGGNWSLYDVLAYGVPADSGADLTEALQSVESNRPVDTTVYFPPGTYTFSESLGTKLFRIVKPGTYDFRGAFLKYGGTPTLTIGSDGGGLGIVNVLADNVELWGNVHCNNKARYGVARKGETERLGFFGSIYSTLTTSGVWSGIWQRASGEITGGAYAGLLPGKSLYGWLSRPDCPIVNTSDSIVSFQDVTAVLVGGGATVGENTGVAIVMGNAYNVCAARLDKLGIMATMNVLEDNDHWLDILCHDLGCNTFELHGSAPSDTTNGYPVGTIWGQFIKSGANSGWFHYNVFSGQTLLPNVNITGGTSANAGLIELRGTLQGNDGTALVPTLSFASETSLGLYRSAASTLAISGGTFRIGSQDRPEYLFMRHTGSGNWRIGKATNSTGILTLSTDSGTLAVGAGVGASLVLQTNGGVTRITLDSGGSVSLGQNRLLSVRTQASLDSSTLAVNEMAFSVDVTSGASLAIRSGSTIWYFGSSLSTKA